MNKRDAEEEKSKLSQVCCVCIQKTSKSCKSAIGAFNKNGIEEIETFEILRNLDLIHYEVKASISALNFN